MTTPRATQGALLIVAKGADQSRVSQAAMAGIAGGAPSSRASQAALAVLAQPVPTARVSQAALAVIANRPVPCTTRWAQCWVIRREDGEVLGFTTLDSPLPVDGVTCQPCHSLSSGAVELAAQIGSVGNQEVAGLIDSDAISAADLHAGRYDHARVDLWLVPWVEDPAQPWRAMPDPAERPRRLAAGRMGKITFGDEGFRAEILTDGAALAQRALVQTYQPGCRWTQFDARCGLSRAALEVAGSVTGLVGPSVWNRARNRVFFDSARAEPDGTFDGAALIWTAGANVGIRSEVKTWADGQFTLWDSLPEPIQIGDAYTVAPSCRNSVSGCKALNNYRRYGGFPDVPGNDAIIQTPPYRS